MPTQPPKTSTTLRLSTPVIVAGLALALAGTLWAVRHFRAEARVRRATEGIVRLVQKEAPESPVSLGLSAHRLGDHLAAEATLEWEGAGPLATGQRDVVQFYVQVRNAFRTIALAEPQVETERREDGSIDASVSARYRFEADGIGKWEGDGRAALRWVKGDDGWRIARAVLTPDPRMSLPKEFP